MTGGEVELSGRVSAESDREVAEATVARIPGVVRVHNRIFTRVGPVDDLSHGQFRHGEERSWGGYGGGSYERKRPGGEGRGRDRG